MPYLQSIDKFKLDGVGGSNIKSIQRGSTTMGTNNTLQTVTISAVDTTKAIIKISARSNNTSGNYSVRYAVQAAITSDTQITLKRTDATNDSIYVEWEVIEFNNVKSLQKGTFLTSGNSDTITISSVNMQKAVLFFSYLEKTNHSYISSFLLSGKLSGSNELTFQQAASSYSKEVHWQVIEFI